MEQAEISISSVPEAFRALIANHTIYDSSCSAGARVYWIDQDQGVFLKTAPKGALQSEAEMTRYFHQKGLAAAVLDYVSEDKDWLLTERVMGEPCTDSGYLKHPERLCDSVAQQLRMLHDMKPDDCPVEIDMDKYAQNAVRRASGFKDASAVFPDSWGHACAEDVRRDIERCACVLKADVLIHGDYCLPNIILKNWQLGGFIDLGDAGIGDRHIDLYWGIWSLAYNLKTNRYRDRFLDAYGRAAVDPERLRCVAAIELLG